jgi:Ca2+-binding RTX toxin-like protein
MFGGDGVDVLIGGAGNDYFDGGQGVNYYFGELAAAPAQASGTTRLL